MGRRHWFYQISEESRAIHFQQFSLFFLIVIVLGLSREKYRERTNKIYVHVRVCMYVCVFIPHPVGSLSIYVFFLNKFIYLFIYFWLCWVFVSVQRLSPVAASGGHSSSRCAGLSLSRPLPLWSTGSRRAGSVVVAHGPSCSAACGIFPDRGTNPCSLHWQADS